MKQTGFILENPCAPPSTRAECASIPRPCNRYSCRYHLWPDTERQGRQHHGVAPAPKLRPSAESCVLDIVESHRDGMGLVMVAELLGHGATAERARQVEQRAIRKVVIASELINVIDQARMMVSDGAHFVIVYPSSTDTSTVTLALSIETPCNTLALRCGIATDLAHRMGCELTFPDVTLIKCNGSGSVIVQCSVDR